METVSAENLRASTFRALFWKLFERAGNQIIQLVVQIALARLLSPSDFGLLAIMLVFVNIGNVLVQAGLGTSLVQAENADQEDFNTVFWICFTTSVVLYLSICFFSDRIALFYGSHQLALPLRVMCLILIVGSFNAVQVAKATRDLDLKKIFIATIASVLLSGLLGVGVAMGGGGVWALVIQQLTYSITNVVVLLALVDWRPSLSFSASRARSHFSFGWKLLISSLLETLYQSMSDLIIGRQFTSAELGLVAQGRRYPQALGSMLDGTIQPVMLAAVSRAQGDVDYVKRLVRRALKTSSFFVVPAMMLFALVAEPLVSILLGSQWLSCVPFLQLYCIAFALLPISTTNLQAINGMGRSDVFLKLEIIKKAYGFAILIFAAFYLKSVMAIVLGYLVGAAIGCLVNAYPSKAIIGYSLLEQARDVLPPILLSIAAFSVASLLGSAGLPDAVLVLSQTVVMITAYVVFAMLFRVEELQYLLSQVKHALDKRAK